MGMFSTICTALTTLGYKVNTLPQEKVAPGEMVVIVSAVGIEVETPNSYKMTPTILIRYTEADPDKITTKVADVVARLDNAISQQTFKAGEADISLQGQLYVIGLTFNYYEIISVEVN